MTPKVSLILAVLTGSGLLAPLGVAHASSCESLAGQTLGSGHVLSAEALPAGAKLSLAGPMAAVHIAPLSTAICKVRAKLTPTADSDINVEVWLPEKWNGKFLGTGGGGYSGGLDTAVLILNPYVGKGYAAAATDVGHPSSDGAKWAHGHPEKLTDWAHRGNHLTAEFGKALAASYYGDPVKRAYFWGCSNGGRDALMEASRYPQDYDGIVAGAPAAPWTRDMTAFAWNMRALDGPPSVKFTPAKLKLVTDAVMKQCDAQDGVVDGVLENPTTCRFDPAVLLCKVEDTSSCLSAAEVAALNAIYQGPRTRDGRQISAGWPAGSEAVEWDNWITGPKASQRQFATETFRWFVHDDEAWTLDKFDVDADYAAGLKRMGPVVDSDTTDLGPFLRHGGKLILYHGWSDAALPPANTVAYYGGVTQKAGARAGQVRLFMVPGMAHCFGGTGTSQFDMVAALDRWEDTGLAPEQVIAAKPDNALNVLAGLPTKTLRTRPLCAWPKQAKWTGSGSTDEAANFRCTASN